MSQFEIKGGFPIEGEIKVNGAKNSALKIIPAALLSEKKVKISNFPFIEDTQKMLEIAQGFGAKITFDQKKKEVEIDPANLNNFKPQDDLVRKVRSSILFIGPLLCRLGKIQMPYPGGCVIGKRPIDIFLDGFEKFGAKIEWDSDQIKLTAPASGLRGTEIFFPKITVTGTEAMLMTAALARGKTLLRNCAMEPEVVALADYLNSIGAKIEGAGTSTIKVEGVKKISAEGEFKVIPDRIETGTFLMLGILANSNLLIKNCNPDHLGAVASILQKTGANFRMGEDFIEVKKRKSLKPVSVTTHEYPGFATDLQPPYTLLMTQAKGTSLIHETIFEGRLFFTDQLNTMGANIIMCDPHRVVVSGPTKLYGKKISSPDLRAGITMVLAGIIAEGTTIIDNIYQIDRGYEKIEERLRKIGVKIKRI